MKPIDPRLLARSAPARRHIVVTAVLGFLTAIAIGFQALVIARVLAPVLAPASLAADGLGPVGALVPESVRSPSVALPLLAGIVAVRVALHWTQERLAHRAGVRVVAQLREDVVAHVATLGPRWAAAGRGPAITTLVTRGLDALMPYFVRYVPQLMLAVTVTPLMLVLVLGLDGLSAIIVIATLPLVPLFMVLIGLMTRERSSKHLEAMARLSERTLDLVAGVPTLRGLGRERGPAERVRVLGDAQRKATMGSLRIAFLSGMVLELLTTLAVAIVAVTLGFRLVDGGVSIETALAVLVLAPEVYLPLRAVGAHFHASADGLAAAEEAHAVLGEPVPSIGTPGGARVDLSGATIALRGVGVATPDEARLAPAELTVTASPGSITALVGPNGEGKSTALLVMGGLLSASAGDVVAEQRDGVDVALADADPDVWLSQCAWVPQRPDVGPEGLTLSLGQRQLAALDVALSSGRPVFLLDEPTAHLDGAARSELIDRLRDQATRGAAVIVATHDEALVAVADAVVTVTAGMPVGKRSG